MNIDDLKSGWQNAGGQSLTEKELEMMTKIQSHPSLRKIRLKLFIEATFLIVLLGVYYDGFDGADKPLYANVLLVLSVLMYLGNNLIGFYLIKNPVKATNIKQSLARQVETLKKVFTFSMFSSVTYAASLLVFFASNINFTQRKYILLAIMIVTAAFLFYYSFVNWKRKIAHFKLLEEEF